MTVASLLISTMYGSSAVLGSSSPDGGASIIVDFAPEPKIVKLLFIVICSVYVPGNTFIISPSFAASIADCIVAKSVGTIISG